MMFSFRSLVILFVASLGLLSVAATPVNSPDEFEFASDLDKRAGCSSKQTEILRRALSQAKTNIHNAGFRLGDTSVNKPHTRYTQYFGKLTPARLQKVWDKVQKTEANMDNEFYAFNCQCSQDTATIPNVNVPFQITICKRFWLSSLTNSSPGAVSQASLIASDIFRFKLTAGVADYTKGVAGVASLAKSNPDKAINNADSLALYAEHA